MASSNSLPPQAAAWAASVLVTTAPNKYTSVEDTREILESRGLIPLRKQDLLALWYRLKMQLFVHSNTQGLRATVSASANKDTLIQHVRQFLLLPGASQLVPLTPVGGGTPTSHSAAAPNNATPAAASATGYPAVASMPNNSASSPFDRAPAPYAFATGMPGALGNQMAHLNFGFAMHPGAMMPGGFLSSRYAAAAPSAAQTGKTPQSANSDASRKRKASEVPPIDVDAVAADIAGAFNAASSGATIPVLSVEERLWSELKQLGFPESAKGECLEAIGRALEQSQNPSAFEIMLDITRRRDDAAEAREMDLARLASEQDRNEEKERLKEQREQEKAALVLSASFEELKNPSKANEKIMFKSSWLLQHEECTALLTDIANNEEHTETKKILIQFLTHERNAKQWFDANCGSKYFFTCVAGKRMLDAFSEGGSQKLKTELEALSTEVNEAMSYHSKQNDQNIPLIFVEAKQEHHVPTEEDDDDDCVIVLERPAQASGQRLEPNATLIQIT